MDKLIRHVRPKTLLDVGANVGAFTKEILSIIPDCQVIMVEANPHCEPYLKQIGQPYDMVALSDKAGIAELYVENTNLLATGASLYKENTIWYQDDKCHKQVVPVKTLDGSNYFEGQKIDLIKLDVQGSELDIINGGINTVLNASFLLIEVSLLQYNQGAPLMDNVVEKMIQLGFCIVDIVEYHKFENTIFQLDLLFKKS